MVCAANWLRKLYLYTWCNIGMSVWHHQSSYLHILPIIQTSISPELMQEFANGKWWFHSFIEFFVIHLNKSRGKNLIIVALKNDTLAQSFSFTISKVQLDSLVPRPSRMSSCITPFRRILLPLEEMFSPWHKYSEINASSLSHFWKLRAFVIWTFWVEFPVSNLTLNLQIMWIIYEIIHIIELRL